MDGFDFALISAAAPCGVQAAKFGHRESIRRSQDRFTGFNHEKIVSADADVNGPP